MIGTSYEMVYYLTGNSSVRHAMKATQSWFNYVRNLSTTHKLGKDETYDFLTKAGCKMVRPSFSLPAVYRNVRSGKLVDECTLVVSYRAKRDTDGMKRAVEAVNNGALPDPNVVRRITRSHYTLFSPRQYMPSVWCYEPFVPDWLPKDTKEASKIIGFQLRE